MRAYRKCLFLKLISITIIIFSSLTFLLIAPASITSFAAPKHPVLEGDSTTVRVLWYGFSRVQIGDSMDTIAGYEYEYLRKISEYTNWNLEFVFSDITDASEIYTQENIDIVGILPKSDTFDSLLLMSDYSCGNSCYQIVCRSEDETYSSSDFATMNGKTIGSIGEYFNSGMLKFLCDKKHISLNQVCYTNLFDAYDALARGDIDLVFTDKLSFSDKTKIIYQFPDSPFYFAMNIKDVKLMDELNDAMQEILLANPNYNDDLYSKYFGHLSSHSRVAFTLSEKHYMNHAPSIRVALATSDYPLTFHSKDHQPRGFLYEYLQKLSENTGLEFTYVPCDSIHDALEAVSNNEADIIMQIGTDYDFADNYNLRLTSSYLSLDYGLMRLKGKNVDQVACVEDLAFALDEDYEYKFFPTKSACIQAVISGAVDATWVDLYTYHRYSQQLTDYSFDFDALSNKQMSYCIGVSNQCDKRLSSVLNKAIMQISSGEISNILAEESSYTSPLSFLEWIQTNRLFLLILIFFTFAILLMVVLSSQRKINQMQREANITLAATNKELERANAAKSDFLARTSHDLRTPMNAIMGLTALAIDEGTAKEKDFYLKQIANSSEFLLALINDVLDMEQIENQKIELKPAPYSYSEFESTIKNMINPLCNNKDITFNFESFAFKKTIIVDHIRFNQIFFNLLSNSVKYTPVGGFITFEMEEYVEKDGHVTLNFLIADTGVGMTEGFMQHMYEPFSQENRNDSIKGQGSGLGLSIVKNMVDLMGGTIEVSSKQNEGTIFLIKLTVPVAKEEKINHDIFSIEDMDEVLSGKHILLVDDQALNLEVAKKILEKKDMIVTIARDGDEAVSTFEESEIGFFDAVLMDIRMPRLNGLEATKQIRNLSRPDAANVPIIAMTANTFIEDREHSALAGMNAHLGKPINPKELFSCLYKWISLYQK